MELSDHDQLLLLRGDIEVIKANQAHLTRSFDGLVTALRNHVNEETKDHKKVTFSLITFIFLSSISLLTYLAQVVLQ